jgi:hypothetical protein
MIPTFQDRRKFAMSETVKSTQTPEESTGSDHPPFPHVQPFIVTTPEHVWDDATGTPEEDAEDIRDARLAMQEEGSIPWEEIKAELGI